MKCHICGKTRRYLKEHIKTHDKTRAVKCDLCGKKYVDNESYERHVRRKHRMEKPHQCVICKKRFFRKFDLKTHSDSKHQSSGLSNEEKKFECKICGKRFTLKGFLENHKQNEHKCEFGKIDNKIFLQ